MGEAEAHELLTEMRHRLAAGPHAALGVPDHATAADVRRAFLELTKRYHPARFGRMSTGVQRLANEVFLELRAAYETLARSATRSSSSGAMPPMSGTRISGAVPIVGRAAPSGPISTAAMPPLIRPPATSGSSGAFRSAEPAPAPRGSSPSTAAGRPTGPMAAARAGDAAGARTTRPTVARNPTPARGIPATRPSTPRNPTSPLGVPARPPTPSGAFPKLDPQLAPILELLQHQQWEPARAQLHTLAARGSDPKIRALLHYSYGREAQLAHRLDEARVELDTALQLDPDLQLAKVALAELFTRRR